MWLRLVWLLPLLALCAAAAAYGAQDDAPGLVLLALLVAAGAVGSTALRWTRRRT